MPDFERSADFGGSCHPVKHDVRSSVPAAGFGARAPAGRGALRRSPGSSNAEWPRCAGRSGRSCPATSCDGFSERESLQDIQEAQPAIDAAGLAALDRKLRRA